MSLQREVRQLKFLVDILTQDFKDVKEEFDGFRIRIYSMSSAVADLVIAILTEKKIRNFTNMKCVIKLLLSHH